MALALLGLSLAALFRFQRNDVRNFERFRAIDDTRLRQRKFLRWAAGACAMFLCVPLAGLVLLGRIDTLWAFPAEFRDAALGVPAFDMDGVLMGAALGALLGGALAGGVIALRRRKPVRSAKGLDITPMLPRNRAEMLRAVPLVLNAGVSEEIFFRLYLPLLMVLAGADGWAAFIVSGLIFGWLHRYQGWIGVVMTGALGAVFTFLYLGSGGLLLPVLFHLLINANALLFRPALALWFRRTAD